MARGEPPRPGSQLPAPYRNPWSGLAEALRAVVADLRLALQRQWRRNREGELPLPGLWPKDLAPLFWPLILTLMLVLALGLASWLPGLLLRSRPPQAAVPAGSVDRSERQPASGADGAGWGGATELREVGRETPVQPLAAAPSEAPEAALPGPATAEAGTPQPADAAAAAAELQLDPLLELLSQGEGAGLLLAVRPDPAGSRLSITLAQTAEALPQAELQEWAQRWQQRAREAGYERLELRDRQGQLRGRGALVGSGMILLAPAPPA